MIFSEEKLLKLNEEGLFPSPNESKEDFYLRISCIQKFVHNPKKYFFELGKAPFFSLEDPIPSYEWEWSKESLREIYGIYPKYVVGFYSKKSLQVFHGAQTWIFEDPITLAMIQVHPKLQKKSYHRFYPLEEILTHEMIHFLRAKFQSSKFEEIFAYSTSPKTFRKVFGPMIQRPLEIWITMFLAMICVFHPIGIVLFSFWMLCGLYRLYRLHRILNSCLKKIMRWTQSSKKARAFLFRLSDEEIQIFSKLSYQQFQKYCVKKNCFRWQILKKAYLSDILSDKIF